MADDWGWIKDYSAVLTGLGGGLIGFVGSVISNRSRERSEGARRNLDHETVQLTYDQNQMNVITARFQALLDGYERRINDLIREVADVRSELKEVRIQLREAQAYSKGQSSAGTSASAY